MDRDVKALKVYCPNKKDGCGWIGEIARVDDHVKGCEISCSKCKQLVYFSTMRSHLDTECPCYCPYCDITAEREVISSEHKEKCHKFPITCPNNIGVDNSPQDKFDKTNESQNEIFSKILNSSILIELQNDIVIIKKEVAQSTEIAKECFEKINRQNDDEKVNKQNDTTLMDRLCNIRSYLTVAVLIIAILIALLLQSPHGMSEDQMVEHLNSLQVNISMIKTELHDISQSVSKLQDIIQHNNSQIEETIKGKLQETKEQLNSLQVKLEDERHRHTQSITELHQQINTTQTVLNKTVANQLNYYHRLSSSVWSIKLLLSSDNTSNQVVPVIVKMSSFTKKVIDKEEWHSNPFFAFGGGYQMCLQVDAAGYGDGEGTHISVYLHVMKGPHDDKLEQSGHWPLRGTFTVELLNQLNDSDHYSRMIQFHHERCSECTNRVSTGIKATGWGIPQFISHDILFHRSKYYRSDSLLFRISFDDMEPPYYIAPVIFRVSHFSHQLKYKEEWISSSFFAFEGGYQMYLRMYAAGNGDGEGTHVSVYLHLMKGPHDDKLEQSGHWPLRGTFTIELLNQLNDSDHYSRMLQFHHHQCSQCTNRVLTGTEATGWGKPQFISNDAVNINGYHKNDSLIFRTSYYEDIEPPYQVAPVTFRVTHFSQWLKSNKDLWHSSAFFAFEEGYQMYLYMDAAGYGDGEGEGTHVSVYLYLMKGPHDDKLEQSGHWPLRGTFTIELLNQLNDSDHYSRTVQFYHHRCSECTNRVLEGVKAEESLGIMQFISHDTLFHHSNNSYYENDSLVIRISYEDVEEILYKVAPLNFTLTKFSQWLKSDDKWYSNPFFAFNDGYQMFLTVYAAGYGDSEGTHVSVYLTLMKGLHDDKLEQSGHWPLRGTFTIELLNHLNDSDHYSHIIPFYHHLCDECTDRVLEGVKVTEWGVPKFIFLDTLLHHRNNSYHENDSLMFRISYEDVQEPPYQVMPVSFQVTKFSQWLNNEDEWYSNSFFIFEDGYLMYLVVYAAGYGDGEGTHVSVYLHLMKGPHDDKLEQLGHWPLRGTFTIELLNQLNDSDHYSHTIQLPHHGCSECTNRVVVTEDKGYGIPQFISHDSLLYHNISDYYRNDSLIFRISFEDAEPPYQVTPVTFKMRRFSQWLKQQEEWRSSPFFAFDGGYQMYLKADAAGNCEGTHVSVNLYLMKGPHDDKLEQSGHWPLRGTFTIELLNQLNDSDHYHSSLKCDPSESINRVKGHDNVVVIKLVPKFISHQILFQHNGYLKSDLLIFRVSFLANEDDDDTQA